MTYAGVPAEDLSHVIELRGVYDGWSVAVHKDGRMENRWSKEDYPRRHEIVEAFIRGEEPNGRWY